MSQRPTLVIVYLSGHLRGTTHRLTDDELQIGTAADAEIQVLPHELPPGEVWQRPDARLATLRMSDSTYELEAEPGAEIWVNGEPVERKLLGPGDVLEIGEGGPVLRFRVYKPGSPAHRTMTEVFSDCRACARHGGRGAIRQAGFMLADAPRELATQTSPWFRINMVIALALLAGMLGALWFHNLRLEQRLASERERIAGLAQLIERAGQRSFTPEDFARARQGLEERLQALESRVGSRQRVISATAPSVVFLQGAYGFVETASGRPLRFVETVPGLPQGAEPQVTLEGNGPLVDIVYTGTAFVVTPDGLLLTNRHVALPWEFDATAQLVSAQGFTPVMRRFRGFLPGVAEPFDVTPLASGDTADVALLRCELATRQVPPLDLEVTPPRAGTEVIVLGYPTGIQALMARVEPAFIERLLTGGPLDFWELADRLAAGGHIAPLATVGVIGQVTEGSVVYDAETTHGGSGGPVLDLEGRVVAVNAAVIPEFGGSNIGVPAAEAAKLLESAPLESGDSNRN